MVRVCARFAAATTEGLSTSSWFQKDVCPAVARLQCGPPSRCNWEPRGPAMEMAYCYGLRWTISKTWCNELLPWALTSSCPAIEILQMGTGTKRLGDLDAGSRRPYGSSRKRVRLSRRKLATSRQPVSVMKVAQVQNGAHKRPA